QSPWPQPPPWQLGRQMVLHWQQYCTLVMGRLSGSPTQILWACCQHSPGGCTNGDSERGGGAGALAAGGAGCEVIGGGPPSGGPASPVEAEAGAELLIDAVVGGQAERLRRPRVERDRVAVVLRHVAVADLVVELDLGVGVEEPVQAGRESVDPAAVDALGVQVL